MVCLINFNYWNFLIYTIGLCWWESFKTNTWKITSFLGIYFFKDFRIQNNDPYPVTRQYFKTFDFYGRISFERSDSGQRDWCSITVSSVRWIITLNSFEGFQGWYHLDSLFIKFVSIFPQSVAPIFLKDMVYFYGASGNFLSNSLLIDNFVGVITVLI